MPKRYEIHLSEEEQSQLEHWVKNPPKSYLRERARAILRIAKGEAIMQVAKTLRVRVHRTSVSDWAHRFTQERLAGLKIRSGRGRKAGFSPSHGRGSEDRD